MNHVTAKRNSRPLFTRLNRIRRSALLVPPVRSTTGKSKIIRTFPSGLEVRVSIAQGASNRSTRASTPGALEELSVPSAGSSFCTLMLRPTHKPQLAQLVKVRFLLEHGSDSSFHIQHFPLLQMIRSMYVPTQKRIKLPTIGFKPFTSLPIPPPIPVATNPLLIAALVFNHHDVLPKYSPDQYSHFHIECFHLISATCPVPSHSLDKSHTRSPLLGSCPNHHTRDKPPLLIKCLTH